MDKRGGLECEYLCGDNFGIRKALIGRINTSFKEDNRLWSSIIELWLHSFELFLNVTDLWIFIIQLWFSIIEF